MASRCGITGWNEFPYLNIKYNKETNEMKEGRIENSCLSISRL